MCASCEVDKVSRTCNGPWHNAANRLRAYTVEPQNVRVLLAAAGHVRPPTILGLARSLMSFLSTAEKGRRPNGLGLSTDVRVMADVRSVAGGDGQINLMAVVRVRASSRPYGRNETLAVVRLLFPRRASWP